ncbi:MAG TPA: hypothetical protein VEK84_05195 [Terriglobales bacterium]|nr:hypothetical protein [Terriglobales bacterium]
MRTFGLACLLALLLPIPGCGNVFVSGFFNGAQTVNGVVSIVQVTVVIDGNNVSTQVTIVTLTNTFGNSTVSFCGDQRTRFPLNDFIQATFMPGQPCADLVNVVIKIN